MHARAVVAICVGVAMADSLVQRASGGTMGSNNMNATAWMAAKARRRRRGETTPSEETRSRPSGETDAESRFLSRCFGWRHVCRDAPGTAWRYRETMKELLGLLANDPKEGRKIRAPPGLTEYGPIPQGRLASFGQAQQASLGLGLEDRVAQCEETMRKLVVAI